jgi:chemotaxis protein MotB
MKKKKEAVGAPLWMVTYSDMVTLLLTFFVMLLAMANFEDIKRIDAVLGSIQASLGMGNQTVSGNATGDEEEEGKEADSEAEQDFHTLRARLEVALSEQLSNDLVKMIDEQTEIRITLSDRILFAPGSSQLHPVAYRMVSDIATALDGQRVTVQVQGHADGTGKKSRNWTVSAERALAVLIAMEERGTIAGEYLRATAMGQHHPANLERGASDWNRRVEIVIRAREGAAHEAFEKLEGGM